MVLVGTVYAIERLATEGWKAFLREQDQTRYTIPMRLGFRGRPVDHKPLRYTVGAAITLTAVAALLGLEAIQRHIHSLPWLLVIIVVGSAGGWATAVGGAWKDAPIEGFSGWKFLRSPSIATAWAVPLSFLTEHWVALLLASGGYSVAAIETYKTFLTGGRPPGKFAGRSTRAHYPRLRRLFGYQHAALWLVVAAAFSSILTRTHHPATTDIHLATIASRNGLLGAVAVAAASLGALVLCTSPRPTLEESQPGSAAR